MALTSDLISQFVKATRDNDKKKQETVVYGTTVEVNGKMYVKIDGSDLLTPVVTTSELKPAERVSVMIKDHNAVVTGNITTPSASTDTTDGIKQDVNNIYGKIANFEVVIADKVSTQELEAKLAVIDEALIGKATIGQLEAVEAKIKNLNVDKLQAQIAEIDKALIGKAEITDLEAIDGKITSLSSNVAKLETVIGGNLTMDNIQSLVLTSSKVTVDNAFIKDAMIDRVSASKLDAGIINTNNVNLQSEDGSMTIVGSLQQFRDKNKNVRIQLGKDSTGDFTFALYGEDGKGQLINQNGITASAIGDGLIVNDMVSNNAAIDGGKLNINSVVNEINNGNTTIKGTKIYLDDKKQTLDVAFNKLSTTVTNLEGLEGDITGLVEKVESNTTSIQTAQGKIQTLVANTTITKQDGQTVQLKDDYSEFKQTVDGISSKVNSLETNYAKTLKSTKTQYYSSLSAISLVGGNWTDAMPEWKKGKYIWQRLVYIYSDGTQVNGQEVCIQGTQGEQGPQGPKGENGQQLYTWVKYADSPTSGISDDPTNKKYIGLAYNKTTSNETTNYSDYTWSLIKGDKGDTGATGQSVSNVIPQFTKHTSPTTAPGSTATWVDTCPAYERGKFLWIRNKVIFTNPSATKYTNPYYEPSWDAKATADDAKETVTTKVSEFKQTLDGISTKVGQNTSKINEVQSTVTSQGTSINQMKGEIALKVESSYVDKKLDTLSGAVDTKISQAKADMKLTTDAITQRVSSTETKVTTVTNTANAAKTQADKAVADAKTASDKATTAQNSANNANNALTIYQQTKMNGLELFNNDYKSNTSARPFVKGTYSIVSATEIAGASDNESNIIKVTNVQFLYTEFIACNVNNPYYASIEIYNKDTNNGTNYIQACYYDKNKVALATNEAALNIINNVTIPSANTWHKLEGWVNAPAINDVRRKAKYVRIRLINRYNGLAGITYLRNISWKQLGSGLFADTQEIKTEISSTKSKVSSIETNLSSITSRVSTVENKQTTTGNKVTSLETWKKSAEQKITDSAIVATVKSAKNTDGKNTFAQQSDITQLDSSWTAKFNNGYKQGIVDLSMNGIKVSMQDGEGAQGYTRIAHDGMEIFDSSGSRIAHFGDNNTAYIKSLTADEIINDKLLKMSTGGTKHLYVAPGATGDGTGRDANNRANSITNALEWFRKHYGCYRWQSDIQIHLAPGDYWGANNYIGGWIGTGVIHVLFEPWACLRTTLTIEENTMPIIIRGTKNAFDWSTQNDAYFITQGEATGIHIRNSNVTIAGINMLKEGWSGDTNTWNNYQGTAIIADHGSRVFLAYMDIVGYYNGVYASNASYVSWYDSRGHVYRHAGSAHGAYIFFSRSEPLRALIAQREQGGHFEGLGDASNNNSFFQPKPASPPPPPPPPTEKWVWVENTFWASSLWTTPEGSGSGTSSRNGQWGQGKWGSYKPHRGFAAFSGVNAWCHGGRNFTVELTMTRLNTSHGYGGAVPVPKIKTTNGSFWNCGKAFARGATHTVTLPSDVANALVTGGWTQLEMWAGTSTNDYSFYDNVRIRVVCEKRV